jgi:transglutaminase-like putative cysteine protease
MASGDRSIGAVVYARSARVRMRYTFTNRKPGPVELWLSLPPDLPMQRNVRITQLSPAPVSTQRDGHLLNQLAYFRLAPGDTVDLALSADLYRAVYDPYAASSSPSLDAAERACYLRSSLFVHIDDEVRSEARRIAGDGDPVSQLRRLYLHLIKRYRYTWPPPARGSESMRCNGRGDCGDYSFLYAAYCRALDIPCRVLVGTFAHGRTAAHVWNEAFVDGAGWIPVDTSIYEPALRLPVLQDIDWALSRVRHNFGRMRGDRLVFSIEPEVPLRPHYEDCRPPDDAPRARLGGREVAWGFETLDGAAPYLQPAYTRLCAAEGASADEDLMGRWWFDDPLGYRFRGWLMWAALLVGAVGTTLVLTGESWANLPALAGWVVGYVILIRRTGPRWWKVGLLVLFTTELAREVVAVVR